MTFAVPTNSPQAVQLFIRAEYNALLYTFNFIAISISQIKQLDVVKAIA